MFRIQLKIANSAEQSRFSFCFQHITKRENISKPQHASGDGLASQNNSLLPFNAEKNKNL
jgi:hypothetical protein